MDERPLRASVVVPAYNAAATLPATLAALSRQTLPRESFEVIVVDDGSTDATARLAEEAGALVIRQANQGPAAARNAGARAARGDTLVFTDADCEPAETFLAEMLAPLDDLGVSGVQGVYRTRQTELAARFAQREFEDRYRRQAGAARIDLAATYAAAFRRGMFLDMGGFDAAFTKADNEDTEFSYRLCRAGARLVMAPAAIVHHRHPATLGRYLRVKRQRGYWRMIVYRDHPGKAVKDGYTPAVVKLQALGAAGVLGLLPLVPFWTPAGLGAAVLTAAVAASSAPFARAAFARDRAVGLAAPFFVTLRAFAFALGALGGAWRAFVRPPRGRRPRRPRGPRPPGGPGRSDPSGHSGRLDRTGQSARSGQPG